MRRPIGWSNRDEEGHRREVMVSVHNDIVEWKVKYDRSGIWSKEFTPSVEDWATLEDKLLELKQRGHLFDQEIATVRKIRASL